MDAIHRDDDGELCGFVAADGEHWRAVSVFGGLLAPAASRAEAERIVRTDGLASLAERWLLSDAPHDEETIVCIQEASPAGVTVALDYYALPGVPTRHVARAEIEAGAVTLRRS